MDYNVVQEPDAFLVTLAGRLTYMEHEKFQNIVAELETVEPGNRCVFDLSKLDFVDSSGLGMFLVARDVLSPKKVKIELTGVSESVQKVMRLARFHLLFDIR